MSRIYTVNSRKFDGTIRRSWKCDFLSRDDDKIDLIGRFEDRVEHPELGIVEAGTVSHERFYHHRWYNYFIFQHPAGALRNYYINICMPPVIGEDSIDYIDLDIDLIVWPDGRWEILDTEEFEANKLEFGYPEEVERRTWTTVKELEILIRRSSLIDGDALETLL